MFYKSAVCVELSAAGEANGAVGPSGRVVVMRVVLSHVYQVRRAGVECRSAFVTHYLVLAAVGGDAIERWYGVGVLVGLEAVVPYAQVGVILESLDVTSCDGVHLGGKMSGLGANVNEDSVEVDRRVRLLILVQLIPHPLEVGYKHLEPAVLVFTVGVDDYE